MIFVYFIFASNNGFFFILLEFEWNFHHHRISILFRWAHNNYIHWAFTFFSSSSFLLIFFHYLIIIIIIIIIFFVFYNAFHLCCCRHRLRLRHWMYSGVFPVWRFKSFSISFFSISSNQIRKKNFIFCSQEYNVLKFLLSVYQFFLFVCLFAMNEKKYLDSFLYFCLFVCLEFFLYSSGISESFGWMKIDELFGCCCCCWLGRERERFNFARRCGIWNQTSLIWLTNDKHG